MTQETEEVAQSLVEDETDHLSKKDQGLIRNISALKKKIVVAQRQIEGGTNAIALQVKNW